MTHTPGPWAFDGVRVFAPALDERYRVTLADGTEVEAGSGLIALVYAPDCADGARAANGTLIAAGPAMLAALHAVWVLAETLDIGNFERARIREAVGAVLDQAEGRTPTGTP